MVVMVLRRSPGWRHGPPCRCWPQKGDRERGAKSRREAAKGGHRGAKVGQRGEFQRPLRKNGPDGYLRPVSDLSGFFAALESLGPLSPALRAALAAAVRREELPARHVVLQPGQVAHRVYFVERGLVRGYALHEGREISSWFMREGDFVISIVSFLTQTPATEYLELLEASVLYSVSQAQLAALYREFPEFNLFGRVLTERYYVLSEQRAHQLRTLPAAARYERLLAEFPAVLQRVASKHIASYLGVAAETLSRLRGRGR